MWRLPTLCFSLACLPVALSGSIWWTGHLEFEPSCHDTSSPAWQWCPHDIELCEWQWNGTTCDPRTPKEMAKHLNSFRMRTQGLQDWSSKPSVEGRAFYVDCFSMKCSAPGTITNNQCPPGSTPAGPGPPGKFRTPSSSNGRMLGHSGKSSVGTVPCPGWHPDPTATNTDYCDMTTMISPSTVAAQPMGYIALISPSWVLNCVIIPRTAAPIATFRQAGFVGLVKLESSTPFNKLVDLGHWNEPNPDPLLPYVVMTLQKKFTSHQEFVKSGDMLEDEFDLMGALFFMHNLNGFLMLHRNFPFNVNLVITDDAYPLFDRINGAGNDALIYIYAVFSVLLGLLAWYVLLKFKPWKRNLTVAGLLLLEATVLVVIRTMRILASPLGAIRVGGQTWDTSTWLVQVGEQPLFLTSSFVTATVWLQLLVGRRLSVKAQRLVGALTLFLATGLMLTLLMVGFLWPFSFRWEWISMSGGDALTLQLDLNLAISATVAGTFALSLLFAFGKLVRTAKVSDTIRKTVRVNMKYVLFQVVGISLYI